MLKTTFNFIKPSSVVDIIALLSNYLFLIDTFTKLWVSNQEHLTHEVIFQDPEGGQANAVVNVYVIPPYTDVQNGPARPDIGQKTDPAP